MTNDRTGPGSPLSDELLRQLFAAAPSAMLMVGADGVIRLANVEAGKLFGFDDGEMVGLHVELLLPQRLRTRHVEHRNAFFANPTARAMGAGRDLFGLRRDGREVPIEIGLNPIVTAEGPFVLAAVVDLTQRKLLEASLRQSEERLRSVVESAPNAMIMVDRNGAMSLVNSQAEQLFGWPRDEMLGRSVEMLVPQRFRSDHPSRRQGYFAAPSTRAMGGGRDLFGLRRDGSEVPIEIGLNPIATADGPCVLAAVIDITHRKDAEARMRQSLQEKETLLREIHHRVKNNMQLVSSILSLQSSYVDDPTSQEVLESCRRRVRSMALVHEKLYRSDDLATIRVDDYVRELCTMLANSHTEGRSIAIQYDLQPLTLHIDAAVSVGLILNELVTNAFKHAFPGDRGGRVRIAFARRAEGSLELLVDDDGIGLPAGVDAGSDATLGLRMIRSLTRQIDGELVIERGPRTVFRVRFPEPELTAKETG